MFKRWVGAILPLLALFGCGPDITLVPSDESHVVVDSFIQNNGIDSIDVLAIVDTSCSMADGDTQKVADSMVSLRADIESLTTDYLFGFLTADLHNPSFAGPYDDTTLDIDFKFAPNLLGYTGSEAAFAALYQYATFFDEIFIREDEDTGLLIFMFSDEKEQSGLTATDIADWIPQRWPGKQVDVVPVVPTYTWEEYALMGDNVACGDYAPKYMALANKFNKDALDLCIDDWDVWLSQSSFLTELRDHIELTQEPIVSSIVVYIDGSLTSAWSYDEEDNIVWLDDVPDYGALVEVGYDVQD